MNKVITIQPTTSVKEAARLMVEKRIGSLLVVEKNKIKGLVTEKDILSCLPKSTRELGSLPVKEIMKKQIITIDREADLSDTADLMTKKRIRRLPVVSKGKLVGIITFAGILANCDTFGEDWFFS